MARVAGSASAEISAPLETVWEVVEDVLSAPDWQGGLNSVKPIEHDGEGRPTLVETETDARLRTIRARVRFAYDPPTRLSWNQEKGDLRSLVGSWELEDLGDGRTRATYAIDSDSGRLLGLLLRGPAQGIVLDLLVKSRPGELKAQVERG
jgi:carbon monoxide dehydrogenase subunit G